jgi:hypothetical protein
MERDRNERFDPDQDHRERERARYARGREGDPERDPERYIEEARRSLLEHLSELGRRFKSARGKFDLPAHIAAHPLAATGAAFALGALRGGRGRERERELEYGEVREHRDERGPSRTGLLLAGVGALAIRLVKEIAMREASDAVLRWWDQRRPIEVPEVRVPDEEPRYGGYSH